MSASAYILFEVGKSISATELLSTFKNVFDKEKLFYTESSDKFNEHRILKSSRICANDMPLNASDECYARSICFNIYDEPYRFRIEQFDWDISKKEYFNAISLEHFIDNKDLLLKIIYPILKVYPQAKFWCENDWFYTFKDLEKIVNRPYNELWNHLNPAEL